MAKFKKRLSLRIPDRVALVVALVVTLSVAGSELQDASTNDKGAANDGSTSTAMPVKVEKIEQDHTSDGAAGAKPLAARFLLFRHG